MGEFRFDVPPMPRPPRHIVVEGPIGVGKTTLVCALAERLQARTVYEVFDENPFLERFYQDPDRYAFPTEMFFLLSRFEQQEGFAQESLLTPWTLSDYLFEKCRLFAEMTLSGSELDLFRQMYGILAHQVPTPDLVLHLHAPLDVLLERIEDRGRSYESEMDPDYIHKLSQQYHRLFREWTAAPVLSIDTTTLDFRDDATVIALMKALWPDHDLG